MQKKPQNFAEVFTVRGLIITARGEKTQPQYAAELGISQSSLSKYENGKVNPPTKIIEQCMHELNKRMGKLPPTAETIARRVRRDLAGDKNEQLRAALVRLLDCVAPADAPGR